MTKAAWPGLASAVLAAPSASAIITAILSRDDVVHLTRDPDPFGDRGQLGLLVPLPGLLGKPSPDELKDERRA